MAAGLFTKLLSHVDPNFWVTAQNRNSCRFKRRERIRCPMAVQNYLRPGDAVILLHVWPTSVLNGADWGSVDVNLNDTDGATEESQQKLEDDFDNFTTTKASDLGRKCLK